MKHVCGSLNLYFLSLYLQFQSFKHGRKYEEKCFVRKLSLTTLCFVKFSHSLMLTCTLFHKNMNETKRINAQFNLLFQKQFYQIDTPRSHTVGHGRTRSHTVGHHRTRLDILLEKCRTQWNTVVHAGTFDRTHSQKIFLAHTVAQMTTYCRTKKHSAARMA